MCRINKLRRYKYTWYRLRKPIIHQISRYWSYLFTQFFPFGHCLLNKTAFTSMILLLPLLRHFSCCHKHANPFTYYQITFLSTTISSLFFFLLLLLHNPYLSQLFWRGKEAVVDTTDLYFPLNSQNLLGYRAAEWPTRDHSTTITGPKARRVHFICIMGHYADLSKRWGILVIPLNEVGYRAARMPLGANRVSEWARRDPRRANERTRFVPRGIQLRGHQRVWRYQ